MSISFTVNTFKESEHFLISNMNHQHFDIQWLRNKKCHFNYQKN